LLGIDIVFKSMGKSICEPIRHKDEWILFTFPLTILLTIKFTIMKPNNKILKSNSDKHPVWLTLVRVILGFILFWKGIQFIQDTSRLESILQNSGFHLLDKNTRVLAFIIPYVNLLGGLFIASGLFTRWTALIQIPILIGAIIFANMQGGMSFSNNELILSIVTFILLIVFIIKGSGNISADEFFRSYYKAGTENGYTQNFFR